MGKRNQPFFRIVLIDKKAPPQGGRPLESLGFYNPLTKEKNIKKDRILYWISKGAQPSDTIHNLLIKEGILKAKKIALHNKAKSKKQEPGVGQQKPVAPEQVKQEAQEEKTEASEQQEQKLEEKQVEKQEKTVKPEQKPESKLEPELESGPELESELESESESDPEVESMVEKEIKEKEPEEKQD